MESKLKHRAGSPYIRLDWLGIARRLSRDRFFYILLIPFIIWYVVFAYKPMYGLQIAFKDFSVFKGIAASPWVGFEHFIEFFHGPYFWRTIKNTLLISLYSIVWGFPAPIVLALLLNEVRNVMFKKTVQTLTYLPHFISVVVVAGIVTNFLAPSNGLINIMLDKLGMEKIYFLTVPEYFRTIFVSMNIWKETGFNAILYIAALSGINPELYEAAVIDGANKWKQIWNVTLPGILPTIMIMFILRIGHILDVGYEAIILLYQPATYETADVISTYMYRSGIREGNYDLTTAVGLFNSAIGLMLVIVANKLSKRFTESGLW